MSSNINIKENELSQKADLLRNENLYKEAVGLYLNAILLDRNSAESYFGLGLCYKNLGDYKKAIQYLEKAVSIKDDYYDAFFELGVCNQLEEMNCKAIKCFIKAIQIKPDSTEAILQLIYQKLIENNPEYVKAYNQKSALLMKMEKYKEASATYNNLLKIDAKNSDAYAGIGVCFEKLGKYSAAGRYYRKFLSLNPFSSEREFIYNRLGKIQQNRTSDIFKKKNAPILMLCK